MSKTEGQGLNAANRGPKTGCEAAQTLAFHTSSPGHCRQRAENRRNWLRIQYCTAEIDTGDPEHDDDEITETSARDAP